MSKHAFLELGSTSIKFYVQEPGTESTQEKIPWELGYDVFEHGRISPRSISHCLRAIAGLRERHPEISFETVTAVGTAALREAQNVEVLERILLEEFAIRIQIIAGGIEAFLLELGYRDQVEAFPTALFDLGGGSLEIIEYLSPVTTRKTSLPMGAIRLHCQLRRTRDFFAYIREGRRRVESCYREQLEGLNLRYGELVGTGGTVRAIAECLGRDTFDAADVGELIRLEVNGPVHAGIAPHRRKLLLPGLLAVEGLYRALDVRTIIHRPASVKSGLISLSSILPRGTAPRIPAEAATG
jgi:exopolyphosphatase/pppGpp-phosphohydrolase